MEWTEDQDFFDKILDLPKKNKWKTENFYNRFLNKFCDHINDSSSVEIAKKINEISPEFFINFFKMVLINNEYDYINFDINNLIKMTLKLIEKKVIPVKKIAEVLEENDADYNLKFNFNYLPEFADKVPDLYSLYPSLKEKIEEYRQKIEDLFNDPEFCLPAAWPSVTKGDTSNPRISKFGGCVPYLPEEPIPNCRDCHELYSMICQIYVPTAPDWFKNHFPPEKQDALIVFLYCNHCYIPVEGRAYYGKDIDRLIYSNDSSADYGCFNQPRIVTKWNDFKMLPPRGNDVITQIRSKYQLFNIEEKIESTDSPTHPTYIGGWPRFVQGDSTPNNSFLIANFEESESSTAMWGDCGTAQLWISKGEDFGELYSDWACC